MFYIINFFMFYFMHIIKQGPIPKDYVIIIFFCLKLLIHCLKLLILNLIPQWFLLCLFSNIIITNNMLKLIFEP